MAIGIDSRPVIAGIQIEITIVIAIDRASAPSVLLRDDAVRRVSDQAKVVLRVWEGVLTSPRGEGQG